MRAECLHCTNIGCTRTRAAYVFLLHDGFDNVLYLPQCLPGYFTPSIANVTCDEHDAQLDIAGCTACTDIPHASSELTCTGATDSQATACDAGYTLTQG